MIDIEARRANVRELCDLLSEHSDQVRADQESGVWEWATIEQYRDCGFSHYWRFNGRDATAIHKNAGLLNNWDTALPQSWWDAFYNATGQAPYGIVWAYDTPGYYGAPYALTADAQHLLDAFSARGGRL